MRVDVSKTLASIDRAERELEAKFDAQLAAAVLLIENEAKKNVQTGGRSGKWYKRRSVAHQASAPGEYPKTDTATLVRNIFSERIGRLHYRVGARGKGAPHGKWLELGTQHMAPRPWLSRTIKENRDRISKIIKNIRIKGIK